MLAAGMLLLGLVALYYGADWLVGGASDLACHLKWSKSVVGLTLVALGTSAPELFVNLFAAGHGHAGFALANVAGSNLTNICLGFGASALLLAFPIRRSAFATDMIFVVLAPCLVLGSFLCTAEQSLSFWMLLPFGVLIVIYLISLFQRHKAPEPQATRCTALWQPLGLFVLGALGLCAGGELVVQGAISLSKSLGVSKTIIGLTIVAAGTSVPDVVATFTALRRKEYEIGVGNIFGSNISNIFLVLGSTLLVSRQSLTADNALVVDFSAVCAVSLLFVLGAIIFQRVTRFVGVSLLLFFFVYFSLRVGVTLYG